MEKLHLSMNAEDLRAWPLTHGSIAEASTIRTQGVIASGNANSFYYDEYLGRTAFVFAKPARVIFDYGYGRGFLLDPAAAKSQGTRYALQDVGLLIECIKSSLDSEYIGLGVENPAEIKRLVELVEQNENSPDEERILAVLAADCFQPVLNKIYMAEAKFYESLQNAAAQQKMTLSDFIKRPSLSWPLNEEILIHGSVEPRLVLGYWDGRRWEQWNESEDAAVNSNLGHMVDMLG